MQVNALRYPTRRVHEHVCTVHAAKQPVSNAGDMAGCTAPQARRVDHPPRRQSESIATAAPLQGGRRLTSGFVSFYWASVFTPCTSKSRTLSRRLTQRGAV